MLRVPAAGSLQPLSGPHSKCYTWRCNRHTFASRLVMAGVDFHTVGGLLLGHRTAQVPGRYAHLSVNHKQAEVERISTVQSAIRTASGSNRTSGSRKLL